MSRMQKKQESLAYDLEVIGSDSSGHEHLRSGWGKPFSMLFNIVYYNM